MGVDASTGSPIDLHHRPPEDAVRIVDVLIAAAAPLAGEAYLYNLVEQLGRLFEAETVFVAHRIDPAGTMMRGLAAWKGGTQKETWEFDAAGDPCHLVYNGDPVLIPCDVAERFENKKDSGYQSFVGYPLKDPGGEVVGHVAVYSGKVLVEDAAWLEICSLFADRAQAELNRARAEAERDRVLEDLRRLDELKTEFIAIAAHDFRGPIGVIRAVSEMMQTMEVDAEKRATMLETVITAADRMLDLVNDYLDVSAMEAGKLELRPEATELGAFVAERVEMRRALAEPRGIKIVCDTTDEFSVSVDTSRIGQVFDNIIDNALSHAPDGSEINVAVAAAPDGGVAVTVADQGPGVPEGLRRAIFDPYESLKAQSDKVTKRFGLGLTIAKRIVEAHGGDISVDEAPDGGAAFMIRLPA